MPFTPILPESPKMVVLRVFAEITVLRAVGILSGSTFGGAEKSKILNS